MIDQKELQAVACKHCQEDQEDVMDSHVWNKVGLQTPYCLG